MRSAGRIETTAAVAIRRKSEGWGRVVMTTSGWFRRFSVHLTALFGRLRGCRVAAVAGDGRKCVHCMLA